MKGVVFNLLGELVIREFGEDTWDDLLAEAQATGSYTTLGSYDDAELYRLVAAASRRLGLPPADVLRWFGRHAMPLLAARAPAFFAVPDTRAFLHSINEIIHPEVRKIYPGADVPEFDFEPAPDGMVRMGYRSPRKLCALAEGFILGAAGQFGEEARITQRTCMHRGDDRCLFEVILAPVMAEVR